MFTGDVSQQDAQTDSSGFAHVDPPESGTVIVYKPGFCPRYVQDVGPGSYEVALEESIPLEIECREVDGTPVKGVRVRVRRRSALVPVEQRSGLCLNAVDRGESWSGESDSEGDCRILGVSRGDYGIALQCDGFVPVGEMNWMGGVQVPSKTVRITLARVLVGLARVSNDDYVAHTLHSSSFASVCESQVLHMERARRLVEERFRTSADIVLVRPPKRAVDRIARVRVWGERSPPRVCSVALEPFQASLPVQKLELERGPQLLVGRASISLRQPSGDRIALTRSLRLSRRFGSELLIKRVTTDTPTALVPGRYRLSVLQPLWFHRLLDRREIDVRPGVHEEIVVGVTRNLRKCRIRVTFADGRAVENAVVHVDCGAVGSRTINTLEQPTCRLPLGEARYTLRAVERHRPSALVRGSWSIRPRGDREPEVLELRIRLNR